MSKLKIDLRKTEELAEDKIISKHNKEWIKNIEKANVKIKNYIEKNLFSGDSEKLIAYSTLLAEIEKKLKSYRLDKKMDINFKNATKDLNILADRIFSDYNIKASDVMVGDETYLFFDNYNKINLNTNIKELEKEIVNAVMQYNIGIEKEEAMQELKENVDNAGKKFKGKAETIFNTAARYYNVQMFNKLGKDIGAKKWKYFGPKDNLNRPFCSNYVGQIIDDKERETLTNDFGQSAKDYVGGWNCRHKWLPVVE